MPQGTISKQYNKNHACNMVRIDFFETPCSADDRYGWEGPAAVVQVRVCATKRWPKKFN